MSDFQILVIFVVCIAVVWAYLWLCDRVRG